MSDLTWSGLALGFVGGSLGWIGALIQSGAQQDRDRLIRHRGLARALTAEVDHIDTEFWPKDWRSDEAAIGAEPDTPRLKIDQQLRKVRVPWPRHEVAVATRELQEVRDSAVNNDLVAVHH